MPATSRATVVLPVPGLPTKTRCRVIVGLLAGRPRRAAARPAAPRPGGGPRALTARQPDQRVELGEQLLAPARAGARRLVLRPSGAVAGAPRRDRSRSRRPRLPPGGRHGPRRPRRRVASGGAGRTARAGGLQLGGRGDRGVADHPHRRLAERRRRPSATSVERPRVRRRAAGDPAATSAVEGRRSGAARQRRPRTAASKKSWVRPPPRSAPAQSAAAPGADSATAAASAAPSARATSAVDARRPAATAASASRAAAERGHRPGAGAHGVPGRRRPGAAAGRCAEGSGAMTGSGVERQCPAGGGVAELLREEPAVRDQRLGVGAVDGVEASCPSSRPSRSSWSMSTISEVLPPSTGRRVGPARAAAAGSRRPPRAGSRWRSPSPSTPAGCPTPRLRQPGHACRGRSRSTRATRERDHRGHGAVGHHRLDPVERPRAGRRWSAPAAGSGALGARRRGRRRSRDQAVQPCPSHPRGGSLTRPASAAQAEVERAAGHPLVLRADTRSR